MALVTIQRSPSASSSPPSSEYDASTSSYKAEISNSRSLSEYYFTVKGFAVLLPKNECHQGKRKRNTVTPADIQGHLQAILHLFRPGDTLQMAVKLESFHPGRVRYLIVVVTPGRQDTDESCLLGVDFAQNVPTIGLLLRVLADTGINLNGDGGFSVKTAGRKHIFKPISVQAMWSALQTLHKESSRARQHHFFQGGLNHDWAGYYEQNITSDQSCVNEWNAMDSLESKRPPSPDSFSNKEETELLVRSKLKEIMMSVDIDEVTSKFIRQRLEAQLQMDLFQYKSFIDQEMLIILGQMDAATEVFPHVYLGSEWNASNLEELKKNGIGYILNVTKEIDNFFPGMFDYLNIRVYDDEKTELLKHWDDTYKYISRARNKNSKVLVHCKMGISRSASVVIAYAMKAKKMTLEAATELVREKRSCIKPNQAFMSQLKIYQGILDASRQRHNALWRSKSEANLNSPSMARMASHHKSTTSCGFVNDQPLHYDITDSNGRDHVFVNYRNAPPMKFLLPPAISGKRPKSWSPDEGTTSRLLFNMPQSQIDFGESLPKCHSLNEKTWQAHVTVRQWDSSDPNGTLVYSAPPTEAVNYFFADKDSNEESAAATLKSLQLSTSVKERINEFENVKPISITGVKVGELEGMAIDSCADFVDGDPYQECLESSKEKQSYEGPWKGDASDESVIDCGKLACPETGYSQDLSILIGNQSIVDTHNVNVVKCAEGKKDDPFSESVDLVFDREEKKEDTIIKTVASVCDITDAPSRNSSWGSFDSAVCLADREAPSRQSSWGSCDTRISSGSVLSRNNSYGAFDCKLPSHSCEANGGITRLEPSTNLGFLKGGSSFSPATLRRNSANCKCLNNPVFEPKTPSRPKLLVGGEPVKSPPICQESSQIVIMNYSPTELRKSPQLSSQPRCVVPQAHNLFVRSFSSGCVNIDKEIGGRSPISRSYSEKRGRYDTFPTVGKVRKITRAIEALDKRPDIFRQRSLSLDRLSATACYERLPTSSMRSSQTLLTELVIRTEAEVEKLSKDSEEVDVKILVNRFESEAVDTLPAVDPRPIFGGIFRNGRRKIRPRSDNLGDQVLPPVPQRKSSLDLHCKGGHRPVGQLRQSLSWSPCYKPSPTIDGTSPAHNVLPTKPPAVPPARGITCGVEVRQKKTQGKSHPLSKLASKDKRL